MQHYPHYSSVISATSDESALKVRPSIFALFTAEIRFCASLAAAVALGFSFGHLRPPEAVPLSQYISCWWLMIVPACFLLELWRERYDDLYVFGPARLTHIGGRLSLSRRVPAVKYEDIVMTRIEQNLLGRLLDFGNIGIATSDKDEDAITLAGVPRPRELVGLIENMNSFWIKRNRDDHFSEKQLDIARRDLRGHAAFPQQQHSSL